MKYLENEKLEALTAFLSNREMGGRMLNGRIEVMTLTVIDLFFVPYLNILFSN